MERDSKQNSENREAYSKGGSIGPGVGGASDYSDGYYDTPTGGGSKVGTGQTTSGQTPGEGEVGEIAGGNQVEGRMAINGADAEVSEPVAPGQGTGDMATGGTRAANLGGTAGGGSQPGTGLLPEQIKQNPPE